MTGELSLGGNKITVLRDPTSAEDAANKQYVDAGDSTVDNKLSALRAEYEAHVAQYGNFRKNNFEILNKFFGKPIAVDMKLTDNKTSLTDIDTRLDDVEFGVPQITGRTSLIKIPDTVTPENIVNISYVVSAGSATWSEQNNSIKYTATVTGMYILSVFSSAKFEIFTRYPWRHSTDKYSGFVSVVLNSGTEEEFILEAADKKLTGTTYWWCLELVAETPQLVTL